MTTNSNSKLSGFSDASAILLSSVKGNDEAVKTVVQQMALGDNAARELAAALQWTIFVATKAIQKDLEAAVERGDEDCAAIDYLVTGSRHAHRHGG